jgi:methylated-DNA-protein-cysteine methyltransferase-like protein
LTSPHFESAGIIKYAPGNCKRRPDNRWFLAQAHSNALMSTLLHAKVCPFQIKIGAHMSDQNNFSERVWQIIAAIPPGKVTTYGDVAQLAGSPRAARQVGGVLRRLPEGSKLPWFRVINRHGRISLQGDDLLRQRDALEAEGIEVSDAGEIELEKYRWEI